MTGTSFSATAPMRLMPPNRTSATITATMTPMMRLDRGTVWLKSVSVTAEVLPPKVSMALLMEVAMVLTWVMLPMPKAAMEPRMQKMAPSHCQFLPRPFLM